MLTAEKIIRLLDLKPHPEEGGYYAETYRAGEMIPALALPERYRGERAYGTCIYYLLTGDTFSSLHRLQSDEIFHFYCGDPVEMLQLHPGGPGNTVVLGTDLEAGMKPQVIVPRGVWQGARLREGGKFALLGTTVAPGFDFHDFEHGDRGALTAAYPQFRDEILRLTR